MSDKKKEALLLAIHSAAATASMYTGTISVLFGYPLLAFLSGATFAFSLLITIAAIASADE